MAVGLLQLRLMVGAHAFEGNTGATSGIPSHPTLARHPQEEQPSPGDRHGQKEKAVTDLFQASSLSPPTFQLASSSTGAGSLDSSHSAHESGLNAGSVDSITHDRKSLPPFR